MEIQSEDLKPKAIQPGYWDPVTGNSPLGGLGAGNKKSTPHLVECYKIFSLQYHPNREISESFCVSVRLSAIGYLGIPVQV